MAGFAIKVKTKGGQSIIKDLSPGTTLKELKIKLSNVSAIPVGSLDIRYGFPPQILTVTDDELPISACGIAAGETLILEEKLNVASPAVQSDVGRSMPVLTNTIANVPVYNLHDYQDSTGSSNAGLLLKFIVPADNSCLFTSIHYAMNGKLDEAGEVAPWLRKLIAETVSSNKDDYSEALLGKPNADYCKWIQDDKSWGGAIEISIISNHYGIEIDVVDTINGIINRFGEDRDYSHRIFLLFDGIHYDPLYWEPVDGSPIQTMFLTSNDRILEEAEQLAKEAKSSRQYTDVNKFTLKCLVCNIQLSGQVQAQSHAKTTGHMSFGEI